MVVMQMCTSAELVEQVIFTQEHFVKLLLILIALSLVSIAPSSAQIASPHFVSAHASAPGAVDVNKPFTVIVVITIEKPYHIQGHPSEKDFIETQLTLKQVNGIHLEKIIYPKPSMISFSGERIPVYEGKITIKAVVKASKPGLAQLPFSLKYQGCDNQICFPPSSLTIMDRTSVKPLTKVKKIRNKH